MNWKRGLFRVGIILTGVWLMLAALLYYFGFTKLEEIERPYPVEECQRWAPNQIEECSNIRVLEYKRVWRAPSWQFLAATLSGPLLLFGIGAAGYWVVTGFKSADQDSRRS